MNLNKIKHSFIFNKKLKIFSFLSIYLVLTYYYVHSGEEKKEFQQDEVTIVSSYYKIKSKHKPREYFDWLHNIVKINKSIVFFSNRKYIPYLKRIRPKKFHYKTVFKIVEIEDFYSYNTFIKEFRKSWKIDFEKRYHTVPLYLIWAEKCNFLKKVIEDNYFNSTCFYWIDAGYFREKKEMYRYAENWPSTKICLGDKRIIMGKMRNFSQTEKEKIINFDFNTHINLQKELNLAGNIFGGQPKNVLRFIRLYYDSIKLFIKNKIFIGKDQNIFTYVAISHPEVVKLVYCTNFFYLKEYLS